MTKNVIFFSYDQLAQMAEFITALRFNGGNFTSENDASGWYITIN
jgi:hypothetical protein